MLTVIAPRHCMKKLAKPLGAGIQHWQRQEKRAAGESRNVGPPDRMSPPRWPDCGPHPYSDTPLALLLSYASVFLWHWEVSSQDRRHARIVGLGYGDDIVKSIQSPGRRLQSRVNSRRRTYREPMEREDGF